MSETAGRVVVAAAAGMVASAGNGGALRHHFGLLPPEEWNLLDLSSLDELSDAECARRSAELHARAAELCRAEVELRAANLTEPDVQLVLDPAERIPIHEAGHLVVGWWVGWKPSEVRVGGLRGWVRWDGGAGDDPIPDGPTTCVAVDDRFPEMQDSYLHAALVCLAGPGADHFLAGRRTFDQRSDGHATTVIIAAVGSTRLHAVRAALFRAVTAKLTIHWSLVSDIAAVLRQQGTVVQPQLGELLERLLGRSGSWKPSQDELLLW